MDDNQLNRLIDQIVSDCPEIKTPEGSAHRCVGVSEYAAELIPGSTVLHLRGSKLAFPNRVEDYKHYPDIDPCLYHVVLAFNGKVFDFTRKQFDPDCDVPYVEDYDTYVANWILVTDSWEKVDAVIDLSIALKQTTKDWFEEYCTDNNPEKKLEMYNVHRNTYQRVFVRAASLLGESKIKSLLFPLPEAIPIAL